MKIECVALQGKIKCCGFLIIRIQRKSTCSMYNRDILSEIA